MPSAKTFNFKNYYETMAFVNALAYMAHREDHHPDLGVHYNRCVVRYSTHDVGGLSENDFICAAKAEELWSSEAPDVPDRQVMSRQRPLPSPSRCRDGAAAGRMPGEPADRRRSVADHPSDGDRHAAAGLPARTGLRRIGGQVLLTLTIGAEGKPTEAAVLRSSGVKPRWTPLRRRRRPQTGASSPPPSAAARAEQDPCAGDFHPAAIRPGCFVLDEKRKDKL